MSREMTNKEAISNLNQLIYGIVSPDIQRSLDLAIKALEEKPTVEITEKQAILLLINNGWLVNHDKELREKWERLQGKWIPVSERFPDKEEYIQCNGLFIVSDGNRVYAEHFDIYDKKCFGEPTIYGFKADRLVIAWRPLPEPYKKGGAE